MKWEHKRTVLVMICIIGGGILLGTLYVVNRYQAETKGNEAIHWNPEQEEGVSLYAIESPPDWRGINGEIRVNSPYKVMDTWVECRAVERDVKTTNIKGKPVDDFYKVWGSISVPGNYVCTPLARLENNSVLEGESVMLYVYGQLPGSLSAHINVKKDTMIVNYIPNVNLPEVTHLFVRYYYDDEAMIDSEPIPITGEKADVESFDFYIPHSKEGRIYHIGIDYIRNNTIKAFNANFMDVTIVR